MSLKHRRSVALSLASCAIILATVLFAGGRVDSSAGAAVARAAAGPQQEAGETAAQPLYVQRGALRPGLRDALKATGDRTERPGKERLVMAGTLARGGGSQSSPVSLVLEFPDRLRLEEQVNGQSRVITFDGQSASTTGGEALTNADRDLIETLVFDSAEHFFIGQMRGVATRALGSNFRSEGDIAAGGDGGPSYEVYEVTETAGGEPREQTRLYYFNCDTRLLEKVQYQFARDGGHVGVEVRLGGWHEVQGQKVPASVVRLENNSPVLTVAVTSTSISPRADDGIFGIQ